jgi:hypothetical protein
MSAYDNDPRVERVNDYFFSVSLDGERYDVIAERDPQDWYTAPGAFGRSFREAAPKSREEADAWAQATTRGPFASGDEAIRSLIGDPR